MSINPAASEGPMGTMVALTVNMSVVPVVANVTPLTWFGSPPAPHMLVGEAASATLSAQGIAFIDSTNSVSNYSWTIPGTYFYNFDPFHTPGPTYQDSSAVDLTLPSPTWHWKESTDTSNLTVKGQGTVSFPNNLYNPTTAVVQGQCKLELDRPTSTVNPLAFTLAKPWINGVPMSGGGWSSLTIGADIDAAGGTLSTQAGFATGTYGFCQVISTSTRSAGGAPSTVTSALDGTFPYAFNNQIYGIGDSSRFHDSPYVTATNPPLTANDNFIVTIMFKAASVNAQWVPVKNATWSWNADASQATTIPGLLGSHTCSAWADTLDHPTWTNIHSLH